jgi:hypothetical protein
MNCDFHISADLNLYLETALRYESEIQLDWSNKKHEEQSSRTASAEPVIKTILLKNRYRTDRAEWQGGQGVADDVGRLHGPAHVGVNQRCAISNARYTWRRLTKGQEN